MPSKYYSSFDGPSDNRSRNSSRNRNDRSEAFDFGGFTNDFTSQFQDTGDCSRGRHGGYRTEEHRPRDASRGRAANGYATENVYPGNRSRSPPSRRARSPSPPTSYARQFKATRGAPEPAYNSRGRSPTPPRSYTGGKYSQAPRRSHSPAYQTRTYSPSPPRANEKYGRAPRRSPSPVHHSRTQRDSSPERPHPGTSGNAYGARTNDRYRAPSPRAYKTRSVSPSRNQRRSSSAHNAGSRSESRRREPAQERTPPKQSSKEKGRWYEKVFPGIKTDSKKSSGKHSRREESRHRPAPEPQDRPRESSRHRPDTGNKGYENYNSYRSSSATPQKSSNRSSPARPQQSDRRGPYTETNYRGDSDNWRQNQRSPSPQRRPQTSRRESPPRYNTEERRPGGSNARSSSARPFANQRSHSHSSSEDDKPRNTGRDDNTREQRPEWSENNSSGTRPSGSNPGAPPFNASPPKPTGPSKPAPSLAALKKLFDAYNARWESMSRTDAKLPMPAAWSELKQIDFNGGYAENFSNHTDETIVVANLQVIFLAGFGLKGTIKRYVEVLDIEIENKAAHADKIKELSKWLSRKEQPRWHPDRINLRTGKTGVIDAEISKKKAVVAMRSAVQALLEVLAKTD